MDAGYQAAEDGEMVKKGDLVARYAVTASGASGSTSSGIQTGSSGDNAPSTAAASEASDLTSKDHISTES